MLADGELVLTAPSLPGMPAAFRRESETAVLFREVRAGCAQSSQEKAAGQTEASSGVRQGLPRHTLSCRKQNRQALPALILSRAAAIDSRCKLDGMAPLLRLPNLAAL